MFICRAAKTSFENCGNRAAHVGTLVLSCMWRSFFLAAYSRINVINIPSHTRGARNSVKSLSLYICTCAEGTGFTVSIHSYYMLAHSRVPRGEHETV